MKTEIISMRDSKSSICVAIYLKLGAISSQGPDHSGCKSIT